MNHHPSPIIYYLPFIIAVAALLLWGCSTSKQVQEQSTATAAAETYKQYVLSNRLTTKAVTAKIKAKVGTGKRDVTLSGNLRMMRDDVIQISLSLLGFEVGRLEFTELEVLVVDRVNKAYARVPYSKVDFLRAAELDFYSLQALFWNELFVPGAVDAALGIDEFSVSSAGSHTLLSLKSAPKLDYDFLTITETGLIDRVMVNTKNNAKSDNLLCIYDDFTEFAGRQFPTEVNLKFSADKTYTLDLELSSLSNKDDWERRTSVSSKYVLMDVNKYLDHLTNQ